ncbi:hypothetical protein CGRA01v4_14713 [Colletotrichum graminicola]|nr:hypothetical protein CGRA01v4_14713 [Colletotrichum graminicola]
MESLCRQPLLTRRSRQILHFLPWIPLHRSPRSGPRPTPPPVSPSFPFPFTLNFTFPCCSHHNHPHQLPPPFLAPESPVLLALRVNQKERKARLTDQGSFATAFGILTDLSMGTSMGIFLLRKHKSST